MYHFMDLTFEDGFGKRLYLYMQSTGPSKHIFCKRNASNVARERNRIIQRLLIIYITNLVFSIDQIEDLKVTYKKDHF